MWNDCVSLFMSNNFVKMKVSDFETKRENNFLHRLNKNYKISDLQSESKSKSNSKKANLSWDYSSLKQNQYLLEKRVNVFGDFQALSQISPKMKHNRQMSIEDQGSLANQKRGSMVGFTDNRVGPSMFIHDTSPNNTILITQSSSKR